MLVSHPCRALKAPHSRKANPAKGRTSGICVPQASPPRTKGGVGPHSSRFTRDCLYLQPRTSGAVIPAGNHQDGDFHVLLEFKQGLFG